LILRGFGLLNVMYASPNAVWGRGKGAGSTEVKIIIKDTSRFRPTLFPGTFKTPGTNVPPSCLCK